MSETQGKSTTRPPVLRALLQVGAAGGVGALVLPYGFTSFMVIGFTSGSVAMLGVGVLFFAVVTALLVGVAALVPEVSSLPSLRSGRVGWALTVTVVGTLGWLFAFSVHTEVESELHRNAMVIFPFSAVPFALVAGLLLHRWYFKLGAVALVVASGLSLLTTLAETVPNELDARLAAANLERGEVFVTRIPGYHRVPQQSSMEPDDPKSIPADRSVWLYTYPDDPTGDCQPNPNDSVLAGFPCTVEQPGLTYTLGAASHQYFHRKGTVLLQIVGTLAVDRNVLRDAILRARPSAEPNVYTTDIDGYEASGTQFVLKDKTQVPYAKQVEVTASRIPEAGACAAFQSSGAESPYLECVEERPDLHYERMADKHVYYAQHGSMEVRVIGGLGVDRNMLREAAVSAHPATDEELMTLLPPASPPARKTFMDRLRVFAKGLLG